MTQTNRRRFLVTAATAGAVVVLDSLSFAYADSGDQTQTLNGHIEYGAADWIYLPIQVPAGVSQIAVSYMYDKPTAPTGTVGNALDIGVFDERGYGLGDTAGLRGWSGGARNGHYTALGLPAGTWIDWRYRAADGALARFVHDIHQAGGLAVAAHPSATCVACGWKFGFAGMDAVEVWNGPWTLDDEAVVAAWDNLLVASGRSGTWIPAVGDSDAHSEPQVIGLPHNVVHADDLDKRSILAAVKAGRLWIAESAAVNLTFTATASGRHGTVRRAGIGERLDVDDDAAVTVTLTVDGAPGAGVRLITDQGQRTAAQLPASGTGTGTVTWRTTPQNSRYVRAEVRRPVPTSTTTDTMVALTNPIFLGTPDRR